MALLGLSQLKIQRGVGTGNITINPINPARSIIICSTLMYTATTTAAAAVWGYAHATIVNETTISIAGATMAWTVIEFGGAV